MYKKYIKNVQKIHKICVIKSIQPVKSVKYTYNISNGEKSYLENMYYVCYFIYKMYNNV